MDYSEEGPTVNSKRWIMSKLDSKYALIMRNYRIKVPTLYMLCGYSVIKMLYNDTLSTKDIFNFLPDNILHNLVYVISTTGWGAKILPQMIASNARAVQFISNSHITKATEMKTGRRQKKNDCIL